MLTKAALSSAPLALFRGVFGFQPGQTLSEFSAECAPVRNDEKFVQEVRDYAVANAEDKDAQTAAAPAVA